ncbi:MAG: hydroxyacid dehydrogenase [Bdellovibrio sp. CG10_big_fil_rev_8_21_14_0_10_47_8]|nr:MAG: hydroxyacid dehydrogenase [Bdellovibrio sp. CG10_big_fil_rev_8_21_14_0_10_47_8]
MIQTKAYAAQSPTSLLQPYQFQRRDPRPDDVVIEIAFCGICHSDIHTVRSEWGPAAYPCVPGHEIVGRVIQVGKKVKRFKVGDLAGVGCFVDSCGKCPPCKANEEQFCEGHTVFTYNSKELDGKTPTQGGYSSHITVREKFTLKIKKGLPLERVAPLLCAGITTYSPLKRYGTKKGKKVGVVGLGGLGHMAVKLAKAMGAEVTVFSTSPNKEVDAKKLGAKNFVITKDPQNFQKYAGKLDLIIDTVSAKHDFSPYLSTLKIGGTHVLVGVAPEPNQFAAISLIFGRKVLAGSLIGGIKETQEMLDFCARKKVFSDIELIPAEKINEAYERTIKGQVKYRFVVDAKTL